MYLFMPFQLCQHSKSRTTKPWVQMLALVSMDTVVGNPVLANRWRTTFLNLQLGLCMAAAPSWTNVHLLSETILSRNFQDLHQGALINKTLLGLGLTVRILPGHIPRLLRTHVMMWCQWWLLSWWRWWFSVHEFAWVPVASPLKPESANLVLCGNSAHTIGPLCCPDLHHKILYTTTE